MNTDHLMHNYARLPVTFSHGKGAWLWDTQGRRYLDALGGIAVCALGHAHPRVTEAICDQAGKLLHTSNLYEIEVQRQLADTLCDLASMDKAFFCNSGAEANEAAIKMARLYGHQKDIATPTIVVTEGSFHGRTLATLTATGNPKIQNGFEPLVEGFTRVPYNDAGAIGKLAGQRNDIVAVMVEPITGEGGIRIPDDDYLKNLRTLCDQNGWLLILDEIQSGMCRTGQWLAYQHTDIQPDIVTLAKALGNGVPIGATLARGDSAELFQPGSHGTTFGGNPLACRAAQAVIETMGQEQLAERAKLVGDQMQTAFKQQLGQQQGVAEIRGRGLMLAIELDRPCTPLVRQCMDQGLLINVTAERVVRLLPPLIISDEEARQIVSTVSNAIIEFLQSDSQAAG